jgi:hypothetical protein
MSPSSTPRLAATSPAPRRRGRLPVAAAVALGGLALMTPSFLVGHPNVFPDTSAYHLIGQWLAEQAGLTFDTGFGLVRHRADLGMFFTMAGARSPYYGLLLFFITVWGSAWAMVALQALIASGLVALTLRVVLRRLRLAQFAATIAVLTLASTLPFFVSFVMPDVFLGLGALGAILLLFFFDRLSFGERWLLGVFVAVTMTFHATNAPAMLTLWLVAAVAMAAGALPAKPARAGLAIVGAGVVVSLAAAAIYAPTVRALTHETLSRPPFLTARLLADGPGRVYLRKVCKDDVTPFVLCRWRALPLDDANDILWAVRRNKGVFEPADHDTRLALTREEPRFVRSVIEAAPLATLERLAMDSAWELRRVSVVDTLGYGDHSLIAKGPRFAPPIQALRFCVRRPLYCSSTPAQLVSEDILRGALIASALYLVARLAFSASKLRPWGHRGRLSARTAWAGVAVLTLLVVNAVICGALSGVYARYEMRIAWLAPLFAALAWFEAALPAAVAVAPAATAQGDPPPAARTRAARANALPWLSAGRSRAGDRG